MTYGNIPYLNIKYKNIYFDRNVILIPNINQPFTLKKIKIYILLVEHFLPNNRINFFWTWIIFAIIFSKLQKF